ncbi:MAG: hypothetical protein KDD58_01760 [Bdellovibrionales bacterium]|nr:hypothetical protein [Bdellovibrionales bacterium]
MRTLCLDLNDQNIDSTIDSFMAFSSRLKFRNPGYLFADITEAVKDFDSEEHFLKELKSFNKEFYPKAKAAIATTPIHAQVFTQTDNNYFYCDPSKESEILHQLPLSCLHQLEGLVAWSSQEEVEDIITFFRVLGFQTLGDIKSFELHSFQQRWGKTGELMWKRLHGYEKQIITPLKNEFNFVDHVDLQMPISLKPYLLLQLENHIRKLLNNVKSHNKETNKLMVYLHCEYNYDVHVIEILPEANFLNLIYVYEQLDKKLLNIDFSNPIKKFDLEAFACRAKPSKYTLWHQQAEKRKANNKTNLDRGQDVISGFLPAQINFEHEQDSYFDLFDSLNLDKVDINGIKYPLASVSPQRFFTYDLSDHYEHQLEIENINHYQMITPLERSLIETAYGSVDRGQHYYLALDNKYQKVCICFDQLEQKYFKVGDL